MLYKIKQARWFDLNLATVHEKDYKQAVTLAGRMGTRWAWQNPIEQAIYGWWLQAV